MTAIDYMTEAKPYSPQGIKSARARALGAARSAYRAKRWGAECSVHYDALAYVVERDGIHALTKSPDGLTLSDRVVR